MKDIEWWDTVDKSLWGDGPWQSEPDKAQWIDAETGFPCMVVRGPVGALCGYVGVPPWHPMHGHEYGECPINCGESWCEHEAQMRLTVHGGVTFSKHCTPNDQDMWEHYRKRFATAIVGMRRFPFGDDAQFVQEWKEVIHDYDQWKAKHEATHICHIVDPGEPEVWWFGFDCCHAWDIAPRRYQWLNGETRGMFSGDDAVYRDLAYVKGEIASLAKQLVQVAPLFPLALPAP